MRTGEWDRVLVTGVLVTGLVGTRVAPAQGAAKERLRLEGRGVQIYRCEASPETSAANTGRLVWVFVRPEADLLTATGEVVGQHGGGPVWRYQDGSVVYGQVVTKTVSPEAGAVPWLVLRGVRWEGVGMFRDVVEIRREKTHGGAAPASGCDAASQGTELRVPYTAVYRFFGAATGGAVTH